jgi:hypothetical protein
MWTFKNVFALGLLSFRDVGVCVPGPSCPHTIWSLTDFRPVGLERADFACGGEGTLFEPSSNC